MQAAISALVGAAGPLRVLFFYGEAARAADLTQLPESERAAFVGLLSDCQAQGGSVLVCQTALEKLGITLTPALPMAVGSLGQWFDLLHELEQVASVDP